MIFRSETTNMAAYFVCLRRSFLIINSIKSVAVVSRQCTTRLRIQDALLPAATFPSLILLRKYAKGKDRKKDKQKTVVINEQILSQAANIEDLYAQLDKCVERMKEDFVKHLTLRSSIGALDTLAIEFEGTEYTLQDLAQIGKKSANMYVVNLAVFPQVIPTVVKAIENSGLGLNPQQDGSTLFIPVPKVTKEHRETLAKNAKASFIRTRDHIRDVQNKFIKSAKNKELAEDVLFSAKDQITYAADLRISEAEKILKAKQEELIGQ